MALQLLWSFGLACLDVYALRSKKDLQNPILVSLFVVGDWVSPHSIVLECFRFDKAVSAPWIELFLVVEWIFCR